MEILKNQTLYKCSYCGKRLLSKKGCVLHENEYCKDWKSPYQQAVKKFQAECEHKNTDEVWDYIPGEAVKEPSYVYCLDCGKKYCD